MAEVLHRDGQRTADPRLDEMTNQELLEAIWSLEASDYRSRAHDHRKHLTRSELEQVYRLVSCRVELRSVFRR